MKRRTPIAIGAASLLACAAAAKTPVNTRWDGVWQGQLDGQPSVTLTVAEDTGELGGTLVLNRVEREPGQPAHVAAIEPHVLVQPRVDGNLLTFGVRKPNGDLMTFTVALTPEGKARIHCTTCGADAPQVDMTKGH